MRESFAATALDFAALNTATPSLIELRRDFSLRREQHLAAGGG